MKDSAVRALRAKLTAGKPIHGMWLTTEAIATSELAVGLGLDYVVVDCEHGHLGWDTAIQHIRAAARSHTCVFIRISTSACIDLAGTCAPTKRALDIGADGVIYPNVETAAQLTELVKYATYPPAGVRGMGAERATAFGPAIPAVVAECAANPPFVIPILESHAGFVNRKELVAVPGVELYWLGPCDHSATNGFAGMWEGGETAAEVVAIATAAKAAGKCSGVVCTGPEDIVLRRSQGFQGLCLGMDIGLLLRGLREMIAASGAAVSPLNSALAPKVGAAATVDAAAETAVPPPKRARKGAAPFKVGLTPDFYNAEGNPLYADFGLSTLQATNGAVAHSVMPAGQVEGNFLRPAQLKGLHGALVLACKVSAASLTDGAADDLLAVSRFGVGYDSVDIKACTENDVAVLIAVGSVDRSMAEAAVGWMISMTHNMIQKHQLVVEGRWNDRSGLMGVELRDRVFGAVGFGGIAQATAKLLAPFGMTELIAYDPFCKESVAKAAGVRLVSLDELMETADFISIHCPLNDATRGLIGAEQLGKVKRGSYLINTARGGIVDEAALAEALKSGKLAGAALDCFEAEPVLEPNTALTKFPGLISAPHCIGWTAELFRDIGSCACASLVTFASGERPSRGCVNPEVFERPSFQAKWRRIMASTSGKKL